MLQFQLSLKFEINIFSLVAFLAGIFAGFCLLGLIYIFSCLKSLKKKEIKINNNLKNISKEDINQIILKYQEMFTDEKRRRKSIPFDYFKLSIIDMINEIAALFYPNSKHPLMELSIDELILLNRYITDKVNSLFNNNGLKVFRTIKMSTIAKLVETKSAIDNSALYKAARRYRFKKIGNFFLSIVNIINPYFWLKKFVINPTINHMINKICLMCYSIAAEETYYIYSKQAFIEDESTLKELLDALNKDNSSLEKDGLIIEEDKKNN